MSEPERSRIEDQAPWLQTRREDGHRVTKPPQMPLLLRKRPPCCPETLAPILLASSWCHAAQKSRRPMFCKSIAF